MANEPVPELKDTSNRDQLIAEYPEIADSPMVGMFQELREKGSKNLEGNLDDGTEDEQEFDSDQPGDRKPEEAEEAEELDTEEAPTEETDTPAPVEPDKSKTELESTRAELERLQEQNRQMAEAQQLERGYYVDDLEALQGARPEKTPSELISAAEAKGEEMTADEAMAQLSRNRGDLEREAKGSARLRSQQESELRQLGLMFNRFNKSHSSYDSGLDEGTRELYGKMAGVEKASDADITTKISVMPNTFFGAVDKLLDSAISIGETRVSKQASRDAAGAAVTPPGSASPNSPSSPAPKKKGLARTKSGNLLGFGDNVIKSMRGEIS